MTRILSAARKAVTAFGALAIALGTMTASATTAQADSRDVAKVLAGVAAIAIIGSAINNSKAAPARPVHAKPRPHPQPGWHHPQPSRPHVQAPRPNQSCVQSGRQVVCGKPIQQRKVVQQPRPQPQRPGWHNNRYR